MINWRSVILVVIGTVLLSYGINIQIGIGLGCMVWAMLLN